ncbi:MAG: NINE protein [Saprospiraceae bacterium]
MKSKWIAAGLAFIGGTWGVHRFYLRQPELGLLYIGLKIFTGLSLIGIALSTLIGYYDGFKLIMMDQDEFDRKYNSNNFRDRYGFRRKVSPEQQRRQGKYILLDEDEVTTAKESKNIFETLKSRKETETLKQSGTRKLKDYDTKGAIEDFDKALKLNPHDLGVHYNMACAYAMEEKAMESFKHLDQAVSLGFNEGAKIMSQEELAYIRIIPVFEKFKNNRFRLTQEMVDELKEREKNILEEQNKKKAESFSLPKSDYSTLFQEQLRQEYK